MWTLTNPLFRKDKLSALVLHFVLVASFWSFLLYWTFHRWRAVVGRILESLLAQLKSSCTWYALEHILRADCILSCSELYVLLCSTWIDLGISSRGSFGKPLERTRSSMLTSTLHSLSFPASRGRIAVSSIVTVVPNSKRSMASAIRQHTNLV